MNQIYIRFFKRIVDITSSLVLLVAFLPFWIIVPLAIKLDSPGPIIFRHKRVGKNGADFDMLKFRSMVNNAHDLLHRQDPALLEQFKKNDWKLAQDPRITKVGRLLRSLTIDEFPQLINVLKGEMSLVGPRAYMRQELKEQSKRYPEVIPLIDHILTIKPGTTGPWQVSGRNEIPFTKRAKLDADYAQNLSFLGDLKIIFKTPLAMISKW